MSSKAEICTSCGTFAASNGIAGCWVRDDDGIWWVHQDCVEPGDDVLGDDIDQPPKVVVP